MLEVVYINGFAWYVDIQNKRMFEDAEGKKPVDKKFLTASEQRQLSEAISKSMRRDYCYSV